MTITLLNVRFGKYISWYLILAVCVFPLLGAHVHAFDTHHVSSPHPLDADLHSHQHSTHDSFDAVGDLNSDDAVVDLGGESVAQQVLIILQLAVLLTFLPIAGAALRFSCPSTYPAPLRLRPPIHRQCQPRAPPAG